MAFASEILGKAWDHVQTPHASGAGDLTREDEAATIIPAMGWLPEWHCAPPVLEACGLAQTRIPGYLPWLLALALGGSVHEADAAAAAEAMAGDPVPTSRSMVMIDSQDVPGGNEPGPAIWTAEDQRIISELAVELNTHLSGDPDLDFAKLYRLINEKAIALARIELEHGSVPQFRKLAEQAIAAREHELKVLAGRPAAHRSGDKP